MFTIEGDCAINAAHTLKNKYTDIRQFAVCGIGGSGIGANLVESFVRNELTIPYAICKGYQLPNFIGPNSVVICNSFSGNTEETLAQIEIAIAKKAQVICISSGGKIKEIALANNFDHIEVPGVSGSPRASIGYAIVQILGVLAKLGLTSDQYVKQMEAAKNQITALQSEIKPLAQKLAGKIKGKLPIFYADSNLEPVLLRVQQQINENSKQLCHVNSLPEMNHNELVGWENPEKLILKDSVVFLLRSDYEYARVSYRIGVCKPIFTKAASELVEINAKGASFVEQSFYLINLLDWVSFYLAEQNGVDAFTIDVINHLKNELSKV